MGRMLTLSLAFSLCLGLFACAAAPAGTTSLPAESALEPIDTPEEAFLPTPPADADATAGGDAILIAYFSRTGNTGTIAEMIGAQIGGDILALETSEPYPEAYEELLAQARQEQEQDFRPGLATSIENLENYGTIFLGYPIWHGDVPMAILSFLESYDWRGKTIVPFCTHGSGGAYDSFATVVGAAPGARVEEGFSIAGSEVDGAAPKVREWLNSLAPVAGLARGEAPMDLYLTIDGHTLTATLADNSSAQALRALLAEGPLTVEMQDYANMEKVGDLGHSLPTNDARISTGPGDLILYGESSFVIYYAPNTWSLTRLGKINGVTAGELADILGGGEVVVTLSLTE